MMKRLLSAVMLCLGFSAALHAAGKTLHGMKAKVKGIEVEVMYYSPSIVRIHKVPSGQSCHKPDLVVTKQPEQVAFTYQEDRGVARISSDRLTVALDTSNGAISFLSPDGKQLLGDKAGGTAFILTDDAGTPAWRVKQTFSLDKDEVIYGLGQQQTGRVNQRNQRLFLRNKNMSICIPFVHSEKGYGLYWDNYSPTWFVDDNEGMSFESELGDCSDYYFIYGGNADGVIAGVRDLSGQAPMYPLWTLGFWQSRERYKSPDELCGVVDKYRNQGIPLDGIVQDWQYWGCDSHWNAMKFQNPLYINKVNDPEYMKYLPNTDDPTKINPHRRIKSPKQMVDYVHRKNAHIMISVWSSFGPWTDMYKRMEEQNALLHFETWPPKSGAKPFDPFNPKARDIYWDEMKKNIWSLGMDAWWLDSTEPDHLNIKDSDFDTPTYLGSFRKVHNAFPLMVNKGVYEHQRATTSDKRVFLLTRSSFLGQQRYGSHSWSGDVVSRWDVMRRQIAAGLNYSLCGIPYWNTDIGGFFTGAYNNDINNVAYHELHVRWYQWGVFQPIMRSHNSGPVAVEIYQFGKKGYWAYDVLEKYTHMRYRLLPYIYSMSWNVTRQAGSIIRPLVMDFAGDRKVLDMDNEYMFGKSFLVCPVTDSLYTWQDKDRNGHMKDLKKTGKRQVYLPNGCKWYDFWTGEALNGGQSIMRDAPIDLMPLYVRAGSIVPWGPKVQYATEKKWNNLEIRVYPGEDGEFTLYEDENDNYNYEKGQYATITFKWNDSTGQLTIGERKGKFKGMLQQRTFRIVKVNKTNGYGDGVTPKAVSVKYDGSSKTVKL